MNTPPLEALRRFAAEYPLVPVWRRAPAVKTPLEAFLSFKYISHQCFILESLEDKERWGRWTFLGFEPKLEISGVNGRVRMKNGATIERETARPGDEIAALLAEYRSPPPSALMPGVDIPFAGGLCGYFSFDYVQYAEPSLAGGRKPADGAIFKDFDLMLFDKLIVWDNLLSVVYFFVNIKTDGLDERYHRALTELDRLERIYQSGTPAALPPLRLKSEFIELSAKPAYCAMVERAKRSIVEGDIFQVVLSNQLEADIEGSIFEAYRVLRRTNPSPYMFYFSSDDIEISGASPETLVKFSRDSVFTFPLAGTRRRGATADEDAALEAELLADPKERAEHTMLVDLGRNDLGRICRFGSVAVEKLMSIERFSHVMHIGSTVRGTPRDDVDALAALAAVLPAGTLSGAPKIRAIEIINELEAAPRGIYGGAIGYISFCGAMDTCISIRIAYKKDGKVYVRSGAGIVADSVPENEYEECRNKMRAVVAALEEAALTR